MSLTIAGTSIIDKASTTALGTPSRRTDPADGDGLKVRLSRLPGETEPGLLRDVFCFQVPPFDEMKRSRSFNFDDYATVSHVQRSRPNYRELVQIGFSSCFVDFDAAWQSYRYGSSARRGQGYELPFSGQRGFYIPPGGRGHDMMPERPGPPVDVLGWVAQLEALHDSGTAFRLTAGLPELWGEWEYRAMPVTIRSLAISEKGGEIDARYFDIELREYEPSSTEVQSDRLPAWLTVDESGRATWHDSQGRHTLLHATLGEVAKHLYHETSLWRRIATDSHNAHLREWTANRPLEDFARRHGHGHKGRRAARFYVPDIQATGHRSSGEGKRKKKR